jgi:leucyl aminopeptidase
VVLGVHRDQDLTPAAKRVDQAARGALKKGALRSAGQAGSTLLLRGLPGVAAERVLLVALGERKEFSENAYRDSVRGAANALKDLDVKDAAVFLVDTKVNSRPVSWNLRHAVLGAREAFYRFDLLKTQKKPDAASLSHVTLPLASNAQLEQALAEAQATADGADLARTLGNLPSNICTPSYLAEEAKKLARQFKLQLEVLERRDLERLGMGAFLAVTNASHQPPKLIVLRYSGGAKGKKPLALVGKGITFDTGGISLKPAGEMDEMKFDMSGAGSVLGTIRALAGMEAPVNVVGVIPTCENMPGGHATKPGDVVTTLSGQTVEILNTDAEGTADPLRCAHLRRALRAGSRDRRGHPHRRLRRRARPRRNRAFRERRQARRGDPGRGRRCVGPRLADAAVGRLPGAAALEFRRLRQHRRAARRQHHRRLLPRPLHARAALGPPRHRRHRVEERPRKGLHGAAGAASRSGLRCATRARNSA